jgi:hypothetical protein
MVLDFLAAPHVYQLAAYLVATDCGAYLPARTAFQF